MHLRAWLSRVVTGGPEPSLPITFRVITNGTCDQCLAKAALECAIGFIPGAGCPYGLLSCGGNVAIRGQNPTTTEGCLQGITSCIYLPNPASYAVNGLSCIWSALRCKCPGDLTNLQALASLGSCTASLLESVGSKLAGSPNRGPRPLDNSLGLSATDPLDLYAARSFPVLEFSDILAGDPDGRWMSPGSGSTFDSWLGAFARSIQPRK